MSSNINTYSIYKECFNKKSIPYYKGLATPRGYSATSWLSMPLAGAAPSTGIQCTRATTGALNIETNVGDSGNDYYIGTAYIGTQISSQPGVILADRLVSTGGLSGTVTTAQTTNLPTPALTRYTSGIGVLAALEIYTTIGTTQTTATISYTNESSVSGRTSKAVLFGASSFNEAGRLFIMPLQEGDLGVKSVESVTLVGTTGTAGNFGVTLFKYLAPMVNVDSSQCCYGSNFTIPVLGGGFFMPKIEQNACLMFINTSAVSSSSIFGELYFGEA
jgi:hypothetical protein